MTKLTTALTTISCALITLGASAQESYQDMHKQLNIMNNIITSSVGDQGSNSAGRINNVDSFYLHDQGVVFTISTNSNGNRWGNYNFNFAMPAIAPIAPVAPVSKMPPSHVQMNFDREIEVSVENAMAMASSSYEYAVEGANEERERYRDLRDEERDLNYEMRDIERTKRDLEYQSKRADAQTQKEIKEELKALEKKKAKFEKSKNSIQKEVAKVRAEQQKLIEEQEKQRTSFYQGLKVSLTQTLCLYGNGLKALPSNEHVSLILKSGGDKEGRRYKDQIYVFDKKDISACSADKINVDALLAKAKNYQF